MMWRTCRASSINILPRGSVNLCEVPHNSFSVVVISTACRRQCKRTSRRANVKHLIVVVIAVLCFASSAFADIKVPNPRINGRPVDWCLIPTKECEKPAADRYCQMRNMGHAVGFSGQRFETRTFIPGTREICDLTRCDHCDRFSEIVCSAVILD